MNYPSNVCSRPLRTEPAGAHAWACNPLAAPLAQLHAEGKVSVLPAVGYTVPNESHFTSRHFWEVGATDANLLTGWMGRYLDLDALPARMAGVAQLLAVGMPLRCVSVSTESVFDTHNDQASRLTAGLGEAAQTVYAFQRDLEARGLADRVLTLVWSEFGRRPLENASGGTDHGAADCGFVIGTRAAGGMIGE
jgi:uncharacterized protein (DUF1501 family)